MSIKLPDISGYTKTVKTFKDLYKQILPKATVSAGSVIYEWVIRPLSILTRASEDSLEEVAETYTLKYLETSSNTTEGVADELLSNYFVVRGGNEYATGVAQMKSSSPVTKITSSAIFTVGGVEVHPDKTYYGVYEDISEYTSSDTVVYVKAVKVGDSYFFNISVMTSESINTIIPEGTPLEIKSYTAGLQSAELSSALIGGGSGETDSSMVSRAKTSVASAIGGKNTIIKMLRSSGVNVYGATVFGPGDPEMHRDTDNPVLLGSGGRVDAYVKTTLYPSSDTVTVTLTGTGTLSKDITSDVKPGFIYMEAVSVSDDTPGDVSVVFGSSDSYLSATDARLSCKQTATLNFTPSSPAVTTVDVTLRYYYMPDINDLQDYMDRDDVRIVGMDVLVKSAVPAILRLSVPYVGEGYTQSQVTECIQTCVNENSVGVGVFNASDIQVYLSKNLPGVFLVSPIHMQADVPNNNGTSVDFVESNTGVIDMSDGYSGFYKRTMFFCTSADRIDIHE